MSHPNFEFGSSYFSLGWPSYFSLGWLFITFEMTINVKTKTEKESKGVAFSYDVEENKDQEVEDSSSLWIIG